ncbi:MAG: hypothetical protein M3454_12035 [Actinomycetota bacterium]|nr:hypothetical protein [Actinomycetota bacterium]
METTTVSTPRVGTLTKPANGGRTNEGTVAELPVRRLNVMRIGYAVMGIGIAARNWPLIIGRNEPWPLYEGVTKYMLVAMGLLALLGLRYPVKMLPILLFECAWKLLWLGAIAVPLWTRDDMDAATSQVAGSVLFVVIILAVIPWRYVFTQYVTKPGEPWRA